MATTSRDGVTIRSVAAQAGVSIATVSRVMRGNTPVNAATRDRVLDVVRDLGYRPSALGRFLAEGRHAANGIVFPDLSGPYYAEVVLGYEEVAAERGRSVLVLSTQGRQDAPAMVDDLAGRVDGMAVFGRTVPDEVVERIVGRGVPVVLIARPAIGAAESVKAENVRTAQRLTEHLIEHGYRRFAFLGDAGSSPDAQERWLGLGQALREAGLEPPGAPIDADLRESAGSEAVAHLVPELPDVIVCANDELALGAMSGLAEAGLSVPGDVAVTGWDDVMAARYAGLTTVRQPMRTLGSLAARMLDDRIRGDSGPSRHEVLPTQVIARRSCGCDAP